MRGKSILALVVALAMIFSVIPAFGLTASAADYDLALIKSKAETLWTAPTAGNYNDTPVEEVWDGWTTETQGDQSNVNLKSYSEGDTLQFYPGEGAATSNFATVKAPDGGYASDKDYTILSWKFRRTDPIPGNLYHYFTVYDASGAPVTYFRLDKNTTEVKETFHFGFPEQGAQLDLMWYNNEDGNSYTVEYYVNGEMTDTVTYNSGDEVVGEETAPASVAGFGSLKDEMQKWNTQWTHIGFANVQILGGSFDDISEDDVVAGELAKTLTVDEILDNDTTLATEASSSDKRGTVTWKSEPEEIVAEDGTITLPDDVTKVTLTATVTYNGKTAEKSFSAVAAAKSKADSTFDMNGKTWKTEGENKITNGDMSQEYAGWTNAADGADLTSESWAIGSEHAVNGKALHKSVDGGGGAANTTLRRYVDLDEGTYYVSYYVYSTKGATFGANTMSATVAVTGSKPFGKFDGLTFKNYLTEGGHNSWSGEDQSEVKTTRVDKTFEPGLNKIEYIINIPADGQLLISYGAYMEKEALYLSDFEIYAATEQNKQITVNYKSDEEVVKTEQVEMGVNIETFTPAKAIIDKGSDLYYVADTTPVAIMEDVANVPVVKLEAFSYNIKANGVVFDNDDINSPDGTGYAGYNTFFTGNWGDNVTDYDRVGIAKLNAADLEKEHYAIVGTQMRWHVDKSENGVYFYAVKTSDLDAINFEDAGAAVEAVKAFITDDNKVGEKPGKDNGNDQSTKDVTIVIDAAKLKSAADEAGNVVIISASYNSLFGIIGDTARIAAGYEVKVDDNSIFAEAGKNLEIATKATALKDAEGKLYPAKDGKVTLEAVASDMVLTSVNELGVTLVDGAQVRVGKSSASNIASDSGLRFIGMVNKEGTLAGEEGAEISVEIIPADLAKTGTPVTIKIEDYQDVDDTIFTAVLTNLNEDNYNRVFTATPVITINGETFKGDSVSRSIFEVASGILANVAEAEKDESAGSAYVVDDVVKAVLNAYINKVGVRFTIDKGTGEVQNANAYNYGKAPITVFDVAVSGQDGVYEYTVTPQGDIKIDVEAFEDAVRINNNNFKVRNGITGVEAAGNGVKFTFTVDAAK